MKQAGTKNPVFLLDEVDKLGVSYQGDPASGPARGARPGAERHLHRPLPRACPSTSPRCCSSPPPTSSRTSPDPLLDRMEVVEFAGYTEREKPEIAKRYLIPRQIQENGLADEQHRVQEDAVSEVISRLHPRGRRPPARARDRAAGPQGGAPDRRRRAGDGPRSDADAVRELLGRPKVHPEHAADRGPGGRRHRHVLHPGGRRHHVRRGLDHARQGRADPHRPARRRDEGVGPGRPDLRQGPRRQLCVDPDKAFEQEVHIHVPAGPSPRTGRRRESPWPPRWCRRCPAGRSATTWP